MKLLSAFIIKLSFITTIIFPQGWQWQNPLPQGNTISSVQYVNKDIVWSSVWGGGSLLKSTDAGNNWQTVILPENIYAEDVFFINENIGWACGALETKGNVFGLLLGTVNGGKSWDIQLFDSTFNITTIAFANERIGWASGEGSRIYRTENGGNSWQLQADFRGSIHSIFLLDSLNIWAANTSAASGAIFYTKDGGKNWFADSTIDWAYDIQFIDTLNGLVSGRGKIANTKDGGKTWNTQLDDYPHEWVDIEMIDKYRGWAISSFQTKIAFTTNGGKDWLIQANPGDYDLNAISFSDSVNGLAVGQYGIILKTTTGGINWEKIKKSVTNSELTDIFFIDNNIGWISGWDGTVLKTEDGGNYWYKSETNTIGRLRSVFFINKNEGFVAGGENLLLKTSDGGTNWFSISDISGNWTDIDFSNYPVGWVIGGSPFDQCKLIKTTDAGETWNEVNSIIFTTGIPEIHFTSKNTGWIMIGDLSSFGRSQLYKTTNGGDTWNLIRWNYSDTAYYAWDFISDNIGWISTFPFPSSILHTTDGGRNWEKYSATENFKSLSFIDSLTGWAASLGAIYLTTDGGKTWLPQRALSTSLQKIKFVNNKLGFAIGSFGRLIKTITGGITTVEGITEYIIHPNIYLFQNYPNPFNSETIIGFYLPEDENPISIFIYDITGRVVKEIKTNGKRGYNKVAWNGYTNNGNVAVSGIYLYSIVYKGQGILKKLIYLK